MLAPFLLGMIDRGEGGPAPPRIGMIQRFIAYVIGSTIALLVWSAPAISQQMMELPPPAPQSQPSIRYHPRATPRPTPPIYEQNEEEVPAQAPTPSPVQPTYQPPPPTPEAFQMQQPVLPEIFRGCWQGEVRYLDSIERLPGAEKLGTWTPKTYRLCYERYGNGPFQLTLSEAGIVRNQKITNAEGTMQLVSTDGRTFATMRAQLHFDEYRNGGYFFGGTFPVDETSRLQCDIEPDGMHVIGSVHGMRSGQPWFRAYWHALFVHVPG